MARRSNPPVKAADRKEVGALLRDLRKQAGFASVEKAVEGGTCPAARQTIYAYEGGRLTPSLAQFLDLVEYYGLDTPGAPASIRPIAVSAVVRALSLPVFHVSEAHALIARLQEPSKKR